MKAIRQKVFLGFSATILTGALIGLGTTRMEADSSGKSAGADIYNTQCKRCHAGGGNIIYPNLPLRGAPPMAHFEAFLSFLRQPKMPDGSEGPMPPYPPSQISDQQARELYQYLQDMLKNSTATAPQSNWNCPYCGNSLSSQGGYRMGPGMMGPGYGMGPGMMGRGYGMGPGMMGGGYGMGPGTVGRGSSAKPLNQQEALKEVEAYLNRLGNPNLKTGKITEKGDDYEIEIVTKDGSLVNRIQVNKSTGQMRSEY
jgi:mono/diheme cytochrome c family protein